MASCTRGALRAVDCVGRLGGDEFVVLLPETDLNGAIETGTKLQIAVREDVADGTPALTFSIGASTIAVTNDLKGALARADEALYAAKAAGRDRVVGYA